MSRSRLDVVLRQRELDEQAARIEVAKAVAARQAAISAVREAQDLVLASLDEMSRLQHDASGAGGRSAGELGDAMNAARIAEQELFARETRANDLGFELLRAQARLADASKRRDVVERLMERIAAAARVEAQRREDAILNEMAGIRHALGSLGETYAESAL